MLIIRGSYILKDTIITPNLLSIMIMQEHTQISRPIATEIENMPVHGSQVVVISCVLFFTYSPWKNNIGVTGAQALGEGLPHCFDPQNLR